MTSLLAEKESMFQVLELRGMVSEILVNIELELVGLLQSRLSNP